MRRTGKTEGYACNVWCSLSPSTLKLHDVVLVAHEATLDLDKFAKESIQIIWERRQPNQEAIKKSRLQSINEKYSRENLTACHRKSARIEWTFESIEHDRSGKGGDLIKFKLLFK